MKSILIAPFFVIGLLATPFVMAYCYPPAPTMKEILRNPFRWPMFVLLGSLFIVGYPFMWVCLQFENI